MSKRLSFSIAVNLFTENFKKGTNTVKNSLRSMQMQVLTFAAALGAGGLGISGLLSKFREVAREISRVMTALKNVSGGTKGFADNLRFVNDLAKKYGLEINALVGNFAKFTASATQANMPMEQQKKVFESVSRAITAFGLSASEGDGVMLALSQMMSKGKISMEELRKQMGEKLPVAIQAMAKALGVSIGEMEKLIGTGKVMSADVLPKFADALNEIIPNVDTDNLETSLSRLSNMFGNLVDASGFTNKYKALIDGLTELLKSAMQNMQNITLGIVAVIVFAFSNGATKIWRGWWSMADNMTNTTRSLNIALTKATAERVTAENALETSRLKHSVAIGQSRIKLAQEVAMKEKLYARSVLAEDRARLAFTQASSQASASLWTRSLNTIKVGAAKLGVTLKSLWSSFAPAILISGFIALAGYIKTAYDKTKWLEKATEDYNKDLATEQTNINILFNRLRKATEGTENYNKIKNEILSKYGSYLKGLSDEVKSLKDVEGAYKAISAAALQAAKDRAISKNSEAAYDKYTSSLASNATELQKRLSDKFGKEKGTAVYDDILESLNQDKDLPKDIQKIVDGFNNTYYGSSVTGGGSTSHNPVGQLINNIRVSKRQLNEELEGIKKAFGEISESATNNDPVTSTSTTPTDPDKKKDNRQKAIDDDLKLQNAKARAALEARNRELQNQQELLNLEQDGFDKQQKQIELNHKKEILGIDIRTQDLIEKQQEAERMLWDAKHPDASKTKQVFKTKINSYADLSDNDKASLVTDDDIVNRKREKAEADLLKSLLDKYQDYNARKIELDKKHKAELAALEKLPDGKEKDNTKKEAQKQYKEALSSINLEEFQDSIDWSSVFGNLDRLSTNALEDVRAKLKKYIEEAGSSLSPTDLQTVTDAMEKMNIAIADRQPITELKTSYQDYKKALVEVIAAKEKLNGLEKGTEEYAQAAEELADAEKKRRALLINMNQTLNSFGQKGNELVNSGNEIIDMLSAFGVEVDGSVSKTLAGVGQIMSGLQGLSMGDPISKVAGLITVISGAGKAIAGVFGLFGGGDNNRYLKMKEQYDALNKVWDDLISKKKEYISTSYGEEARKVSEEAKRLTEKQIESNRELGKAYMNSFKNKGGSSWGVRQQSRIDSNDWSDLAEWKKLNNISDDLFGSVTTGRMTGLFDLTADQLESLKEEAPSLWAKLEEQTKEYLDNIIDGADRLEDINKSLKEQYTQISLDSFKDNYIDLLSDMDSSNQDFADNFEKYIQKAILSSLIGSKYKSQIESLYDDFANANSDGNIDEIEMAALKKKQEELAAQMIADRDKLKETFGWESDSTKSQDSSTKGYSVSMDQDTGGAILGRITGIHESILTLTSMVSGITIDTSKSLTYTTSISDELKKHTEIFHEMRDIQTKTLTISKEMKESIGVLDDMKDTLLSINKNTKGLAPR